MKTSNYYNQNKSMNDYLIGIANAHCHEYEKQLDF